MMFDDFWKIYPRRVAKFAARNAWDKAVKIASPGEIIEGARKYAQWLVDGDGWKPQPAHPSTWLNQGRWMDELNSKPAFNADAYRQQLETDRRAREEARQFRERLFERDNERRH